MTPSKSERFTLLKKMLEENHRYYRDALLAGAVCISVHDGFPNEAVTSLRYVDQSRSIRCSYSYELSEWEFFMPVFTHSEETLSIFVSAYEALWVSAYFSMPIHVVGEGGYRVLLPLELEVVTS